MKKISMVLISLLSVILFSGCGKVNMGSNTTVNSDGSGQFIFKVVYDSVTASLLENQSILNADGQQLPKGEQVRKYMQGKDYAEDYIISFKDLKSLNEKFNSNEDIKVSIKENKGFFHNTYTYEMKFLQGFAGSDVNTSAGNNDSIPVSNKKEINDFISEVPFINSVTLPGKILSTNAINRDGNTIEWTYSLGQLTPDVAMTATYTMDNRVNYIITYVTSICVGIGLLFFAFIKIRRRLIK